MAGRRAPSYASAMKRSMLMTLVLSFALASALGCSKESKDSKKSETVTKSETATTAATKGNVATAQLLMLKFHHDN